MLILNLCKNLQNLKILDCLELKNIIMLSCQKIGSLEMRNCGSVTTFNISASVNILILNEINWFDEVEIDTFNVKQIKSNYSHFKLKTFNSLLENKKKLFGKKPVLHLELNYSYINLPNSTFKNSFHESLGKVKNNIQIAYSFLVLEEGDGIPNLIKINHENITLYKLSKKKTLRVTEENLMEKGIDKKYLKYINGFS